MVEYKIIEGYTTHGTAAYRVGNDGSVQSRKKKIGNRWILSAGWNELKCTVHHDGYRYVSLYQGGNARIRKVSVLVALEFIGPKPEGQGRGERNGFAKLTDAQVAEIRSLDGLLSHAKIGGRFGVSQAHVSRIIRGDLRKIETRSS